MMKLNLGCGMDHKNGYLNCDISKDVNPDKIVDLEKKLEFDDSSVDEIVVNHVLEHVRNLIPLMEEFWRICKNGSLIKVTVPYFSFPGAFQDPTHVRFFTLKTFGYFSSDNNLSYYSKSNFEIVSTELVFFKRCKWIDSIARSMCNLKINRYERHFAYLFPAEELNIVLKVVK